MTVSIIAVFWLLSLLAAANGANDVSRAAATLVSGGDIKYGKALLLTIFCTLGGSLCSGWLAAGVARRFASAIPSGSHPPPAAILSIILGAACWIVLATRKRLPVATTHAILGSLLGVTLLLNGWGSLGKLHLGKSFALPLLTSPVIALIVALLVASLHGLLRSPLKLLERAHWISCGLVAFSRGVNDSAKIWALVLPLAVLANVPVSILMLAGLLVAALAMFLGGLFGGRSVTETLAFDITAMGDSYSAIANLTTACIIIAASLLTFPVASSHVITGAILGVGLARGKSAIQWNLIRQVFAAWALTLPAAALFSAVILIAMQRLYGIIGNEWVLYSLAAIIPFAIAAYLLFPHISNAAWPVTFNERLIIFVCTSNTSRSPMAAMICQSLLSRSKANDISLKLLRARVISRGLAQVDGKPMSGMAASTLQQLGFKQRQHMSKLLTEASARTADVIFCMTQDQVTQVKERFPELSSKVHRLDDQRDIPDPSTGDEKKYAAIAGLLEKGITTRLTWLSAPALR